MDEKKIESSMGELENKERDTKMGKKYKALSKKTIAIVVGVMILAPTGVITYTKFKDSNETNSELVSREREYEVKRGDIIAGSNGSGSLKLQAVNQNFEEPVEIGELFVKEGERVSIGDKIATISEKFINDKLEELNSQLERATATLVSTKNNKQVTVLTQNKAWEDKVQGSKNQYESQRNSLVNNINQLTDKLNDVNKKLEDVRRQIEEMQNLATARNVDENHVLQENSTVEDTNLLQESNETKESDAEEIEAKLQELKLTESTLLSEKSLLETEIKNTNQSLNSLDVERTKEKESEVKEESANREINALTNSELDHSINNAQKEVDKINEQIAKVNKLKENSTLYAQIDGTILNLNYTVGSTTSSEIPIVTIGENAKVFAEITVTQEEITKIEEGQRVNLIVSAYQDQMLEGTVSFINLKPNGQGSSVNYSVMVEISENDLKLLEGMTVSAQFIVKDVKDVLTLSNKAITLKDGKQFVQVKQDDGTLKEVEITTGFSDGKISEIVSGLSEGDTVVVGG